MVSSDNSIELLKWVPSALVTSTTFLGISWESWVYILTAVYTAMQMADWVWVRIKNRRNDEQQTRRK